MARDTPTKEFNIKFSRCRLYPYMNSLEYPKFSIAIEYGAEYGDYDDKEFIADFSVFNAEELGSYIEDGYLHDELEEFKKCSGEEFKNYNHLEVNIYFEYDCDSIELVDTIYKKEKLVDNE